MARSEALFPVEIVYALRGEQALLALEVAPGTTVQEAIEQSGIRKRFPHIDPERSKVGIFGKRVTMVTMLKEGDRVEIYRPLVAEPKDARRQRAQRKR